MAVYRVSTGASTNHHLPNDQSATCPPSVTDSKLPKQLEPYLKLHRNGIKYMQCDLCQFICRPLSSLFTRHYTTHFSSNPSSNPLLDCLLTPVPPEQLVSVNEEPPPHRKVYKCRKCGKRFYRLNNYQKHFRNQHKPPFSCQLCSCTYRSKKSYLAHCQRHNRPKAIFHCEQCDRHFHSKDGLTYHRRNTCLRYKCQHCERILPTNSQLQQHLREAHKEVASSAQLRQNGDPSVRCICFVCGKTVKEMNLGRHMLVHKEERPFICDLCGKCFKFKGALREHIITEMGMKDYVCEVCGRKFVKRCYLMKHSHQHQQRSTAPKRSFECDLCDAQFTELRQLSVHRRQHKELSCELCAETFKSQAQFQEHQLTELVCHLCHEMFASNERLRQHVIANHIIKQYRQSMVSGSTSSAVYPCELCGRKFTSLVKFNEHTVTEVRCELCETTFDTYPTLRQHVESVHNLLEYRKVAHLRWRSAVKAGTAERPMQRKEYTCSVCNKKLFYKRTLMLHERMHSGLKPYKCERCDKAFVSKPSLRAHLVAEMNLRKFACEYCPKRYNFQADLLAHMKQCHKKRQYSCHVCSREFGLLKCLNDHLTMHSSVKPFTCDKCNLSFRLKKFLVRHTRKYHQEAQNSEMLTEVVVES